MLSKKLRLSSANMQLRNAKTLSFEYFLIKKAENNLGHLRVGVVISTKVAKSSVERHRIKRQIMESVRLNWDLNKGWDVVIIVSPKIATLDNKTIQEAIRKIYNS